MLALYKIENYMDANACTQSKSERLKLPKDVFRDFKDDDKRLQTLQSAQMSTKNELQKTVAKLSFMAVHEREIKKDNNLDEKEKENFLKKRFKEKKKLKKGRERMRKEIDDREKKIRALESKMYRTLSA
ncbi:Oidioi.mRNA.OKI2018_I69.XSR.g14776.t1.cds [Oikopleura dioica]|uniref:Oidioi.mRNA.OKI2018_I69.XSR.g14776.t1.cds n=1 Tax=Oikopleura dioica TaxID=34765 RepID=A0ABN7SH40_OIKDI|nr:Oidioi.mRNA.OKI2018_I69.XSR.g14776.t1.cds [Oikopleura dioica]